MSPYLASSLRVVNNVVTEIRNYDSLNELSETLEEDISFCKNAIGDYRERLGSILRKNEATNGDNECFKALSGLQNGSKETKNNRNNKSKGKSKKKGAKSGWIQFKGIMLSMANHGEAQILFDISEDLKGKIAQLEKIRDAIEDLKRLGLEENIIYITYMHEGIPEKIVLHKKNGDNINKRFKFMAKISQP